MLCTHISSSYPAALELLSSGKVDVKPLITHRYKLTQVGEAFERAQSGRGGAIKVLVDCTEKSTKMS